MFFYSMVYQLDIYLVTVFFMFNMKMFNIETIKKQFPTFWITKENIAVMHIQMWP